MRKRFDVEHVMTCTKGGFVHGMHDDVRDQFASLLKDVCHDVYVEPHLQTLRGESCPLIKLVWMSVRTGFWQRAQRALFDVTVFNPFAKSHLKQKLDTAFTSNENVKNSTTFRELLKSCMAPLALQIFDHMGEAAE